MLATHLSLENNQMISIPVSPKHLNVVQKIKMARKVNDFSEQISNRTKNLFKDKQNLPVSGVLQLVSLALLPFKIYKFAGVLIKTTKSSIDKKIDALLEIASDVDDTVSTLKTAAKGLIAVGLVAKEPLRWLWRLSIICSVAEAVLFEGVGMFFSTINLMENRRLSNILTKERMFYPTIEQSTVEKLKFFCKLIKECEHPKSDFGVRHFKVKGSKLIPALKKIKHEAKSLFSSAQPEDIQVGRIKIHQTLHQLSKRLTVTKWSLSLKMIAATINMIGVAFLITPFPIVAIALMSVSAALFAGVFLHDKIQTHYFKKSLGMN
jgi:hypothetical protein